MLHYASRQTVSFALHAVAETLQISKDDVAGRYDDIERELLKRFYEFARDRRETYWVHWNMRSITYGFEHLEHRYRVLNKTEPPSIPVEVRLNLNDMLKQRCGNDYAPDPKMYNLVKLNGEGIQGLLTGAEESEAFKQHDFIRMNASAIAKVSFFQHVIEAVLQGKLKTAGKGILVSIDRLLESRIARAIAFFSAVIGIIAAIIGFAR